MSQIRFIVDEDTDPDLIDALLRAEAALNITRVGWEGAPPSGTKDQALIAEAEKAGRMLVSRDKKSMPGHLTAHYVAGGHTHGVALLREGYPMRAFVDDLILLWVTMEAEDVVDGLYYLPMQ